MDRRLRALIVEDSLVILDNLTDMLDELADVEVVGAASTLEKACSWADTHTQGCDVAIIDVFLGSGSGIDALRHLRSYARPPDCVMLTNYATPDIKARCHQLGAAATFDKSTQIDELVAWLRARSARV